MIIRTVYGYDFFEMSSAMQKAIGRADTGIAGFSVLELWASGYRDYVLERLFTISAEDCFGIITKEIEALRQEHELVNKTATEPKGGIFINEAVILPCGCRKNRDADHLRGFIYDREDIDVEKWVNDIGRYPIPVPDYTFNVHTRDGKKHGRTKEESFRKEYKALRPRVSDLFDDLAQSSQPKSSNDEATTK